MGFWLKTIYAIEFFFICTLVGTQEKNQRLELAKEVLGKGKFNTMGFASLLEYGKTFSIPFYKERRSDVGKEQCCLVYYNNIRIKADEGCREK